MSSTSERDPRHVDIEEAIHLKAGNTKAAEKAALDSWRRWWGGLPTTDQAFVRRAIKISDEEFARQ